MPALRQPLRFREAIAPLHDIVISDLRHTGHAINRPTKRIRHNGVSAAINFAARSRRMCTTNCWRAARTRSPRAWNKNSMHAARNTGRPGCAIPISSCSTIPNCGGCSCRAIRSSPSRPDVVFSECFSADESSPGCLSVDRDILHDTKQRRRPGHHQCRSWDLFLSIFQHFCRFSETLFRRSIPPASMSPPPGSPEYREEKDRFTLPVRLRGLMQLQSAMRAC